MKDDITKNQVAVIGLGCYYPGAKNPKQLWENILTKRRQFRRMPDCRLPLSLYHDPDPKVPDKTYGKKAALIDGYTFDWAKRRIPKTAYECTDIAHWLALDVAEQAIEDAGYDRNSIPQKGTGVIVGNTLTGELTRSQTMRLRWPYIQKVFRAVAHEEGISLQDLRGFEQTFESTYKSVFAPITEDSLAGGLSNTIAGRICNYFDLNGGGYTVDGACSSSLLALITAARALADGDMDMALAGGVDISLDTFELIGFAKTGALTKSDMTVYDERGSGFIPGEGCGFVVLKRLEDAKRDGDNIYALLNGWGISSDGKGGITAPSSDGQALSLSRAYDKAGYDPSTLHFIEGHGTGTKVGDRVELQGVAKLLHGEESSEVRSCGMTSFKSIVGHTKAAAGIGAFIKAVIAVNRRVLPPTAACKYPHSVFNEEGKKLYPILQGSIVNPGQELRAGVSAMGFGGINSHVTLSSGDFPFDNIAPSIEERALLVSSQETEIFIISSGSFEQLLNELRELSLKAEEISLAELTDLAADRINFINNTDPIRAALIVKTPDELVENLQQLEQMITSDPPDAGQYIANNENTIWIGNSIKSKKVGFLFPGQGSQKLNMTRVLIERFSWARGIAEEINRIFDEQGISSLLSVIYKPLDRGKDKETTDNWFKKLSGIDTAQGSVLLSSLLWFEFITRLGIRPAAVGGHSLGELMAFYAAGAYNREELIRFTALRGKSMAEVKTPGKMVSLRCSLKEAEELLAEVNQYADIANINSPNQIIVSGEIDAIDEVIALAKKKEINSYLLPVSGAFHTKLMKEVSDIILAKAPIPEKISNLNCCLFSSVTGEEVDKDIQLHHYFANQAASRVHFVSMANSILEKCDILLEVGIGEVLSRLVASFIPGKPSFPLENTPNNDLSFNRALASLFVNGISIKWEEVYSNRLTRPFVSASQMDFIVNPLEKPLTKTGSPQGNYEVKDFIRDKVSASLDVHESILSQYLSKRGEFISTVVHEIIKADMNSAPLDGSPVPVRSKPAAKSRPAPVEQPSQETTIGGSIGGSTGDSIKDTILDIIAGQTGFDKENLSSELRLLDDLNLDSIKAGELIANAAKALNINGDIDASRYANSSLHEVVESFKEFLGAGDEHSPAKSAPVNGAGKIEEILLAALSRQTGFDKENLSLELRLLDDLNLDSIKAGEAIGTIAQELNIQGQIDPAHFANSSLQEIIDSLSELVGGGEAAASPEQTGESLEQKIEDGLLNVISRQTGFDKDNLSTDLRLLDDLNLDSIKAGEVIAACAKTLNIRDDLDPGKFANASLREIKEFFNDILSKGDKTLVLPSGNVKNILLDLVAGLTGFDRDNLSADLRLLDDLNLDSIKAGELVANAAKMFDLDGQIDPSEFANSSLSDIAQSLEKYMGDKKEIRIKPAIHRIETRPEESWVRNFAMKEIYKEIPPHRLLSNKETWKKEKILLISSQEDQDLNKQIRQGFSKHGIEVISTLFENIDLDDINRSNYSDQHIIAIIPQFLQPERYLNTDLSLHVQKLHYLVRFVKSGIKSISFAQYNAKTPEENRPGMGTGCAASFAASLHHENPGVKIRLIDFSPDLEKNTAVELIMNELNLSDTFIAAGYNNDIKRYERVPELQKQVDYTSRPNSPDQADILIITGGAKGITAECAIALAKKTGAKMALIGSSTHPGPAKPKENEIAATLDRFNSLGLGCSYYQCDITNFEELKNTCDRIAEEMGTVTGIIHGAGMNRPRLAEQVSIAEAQKEIAPKLKGAMNLCKIFSEQNLKIFAGFSSIIGVTGMPGNAWYAFSNEALIAILRKFKENNTGTAIISIAYSIWGEVGMGAKMGSTHSLAQMGIGAIPTEEGVARFLRLIENDPGTEQVIVTARLGGLDTWSPRTPVKPAASRFLEKIITFEPGVEIISRALLKAEYDLYLLDHNYKGSLLFPTVFGLEAMAQSVAYVCGKTEFGTLQIEDIDLNRPIVVNAGTGTEIQARALVIEPKEGDNRIRIKVGISTEQNAFKTDNFSALFILDNNENNIKAKSDITLPDNPLDIIPKIDLYGWLLFQGALFQRIESVYDLAETEALFTSEKMAGFEAGKGCFQGETDTAFILGDPFFRDTALQSIQLSVTRDIALPVKIKRLELFNLNENISGKVIIKSIILHKDDEDIASDVIAATKDNRILERFTGYDLKILEYRQEHPTWEELKKINKLYEQILRKEYAKFKESTGVAPPKISLYRYPNLIQYTKRERHNIEKSIFRKTLMEILKEQSLETEGREAGLAWEKSGKPIISGMAQEDLYVSFSHDDDFFLSSVAMGPQGCDIEPIKQRAHDDWKALLGNKKNKILDELLRQGEDLDVAGTRIWSVVEAFKKASGNNTIDILLTNKIKEGVLFSSVVGGKEYTAITFPVKFYQPLKRIIAIVLDCTEIKTAGMLLSEEKDKYSPPPEPADSFSDELIKEQYNDTFAFDGLDENGHRFYIHRFRLSFKDAGSFRKKIPFSFYSFLMGKLREMPMKSVQNEFVKDMISGEWGIVTNNSTIHIVGEATSFDLIEGRLYTPRIWGEYDTSVDLAYEFFKIGKDGSRVRIAHAVMGTTWVKIVGHGLVAKEPLPQYLHDLIHSYLAEYTMSNPGVFPEIDNLTPGPVVLKNTSGPKLEPIVAEQDFSTSYENSNVVGNIYYANYYTWQGYIMDRFLFQNLPDYFGDATKPAYDLFCVSTRVDHLREAMPFDTIKVTMAIKSIHENGASFYFEYFRVEPDGQRVKLAIGEVESVWVGISYDPDSVTVEKSFPPDVLEALKSKVIGGPGGPGDR
ncbi:MAG: SDR family NAD(P)-dependent oxidoreductase [bacterium]|nr:SDR family NAD(P)-dependent oxidoreductase [bacterium]